MTTRYLIGVDVGGTFTDVVGIADTGEVTLVKVSSTPHDQSEGVLAGIEKLAGAVGLTNTSLLEQTDRLVHGTTVATNALLEHRGARVAMLTTEGHRDVVEMREGLKPDRYDLRLGAPEPLIPRSRRIPVSERLRDDGQVEVALDPDSLSRAIETAKAERTNSVAICFLHSWRDPSHEYAAAEAVCRAMPEVFVTCSADVLPEIKEFERFNTTAVNAYVGPAVSSYLNNLVKRLEAAKFTAPLFIILSNGGVAPAREVSRLAVATALSGPAGGVAAAVSIAKRYDVADIITFDMGGTSTDIAVVTQGQAMIGRGRSVGGERIALESLDIVTIGAGGGSIAETGSGGTLRVGPRSAGSMPGPAAYGQGGTAPTVTDANLVLGYLDANEFLGGQRALDSDAARSAMERVGKALGVSVERTAAGIIELANARMADGIRMATIRRGIDPRDMTLLSFGGAAGLHSAAVAREVGMKTVMVPVHAAGLSAWGMLHTDLRYEASRTVLDAAILEDEGRLRGIFEGLRVRADREMRAWWQGDLRYDYRADMRYGEQVFEIDVDLKLLDFDKADLPARMKEAFHARHRDLFTYDLPGEHVVLVNARVAAIGKLPEPPVLSSSQTSRPIPVPRTRRVHCDGEWQQWPVYSLESLRPGDRIEGPALTESATTTLQIGPGDLAVMLDKDMLRLDVRKPAPKPVKDNIASGESVDNF